METIKMQKNTSGEAPRIIYKTHGHRRDLKRLLEDVLHDVNSSAASLLLGSAGVEQHRGALLKVEEHLAEPFNLVVLGDFKRGKSTLINAILGQELVSSDVTPETLHITELYHSAKRQLVACLKGGAEVELHAEDLRSSTLGPHLERLPQPTTHLRLGVPVAWLEDLRITDTPGSGDIMRRFDDQVRAYLPAADTVLYVTSAHAPLSATERHFLQRSLKPLELSKICFLINMADQLRSVEDMGRVREHVKAQLTQDFPHSPVFIVSALDEFARQIDGPRPETDLRQALELEFTHFREHLQEAILLNRDTFQLQNGLRGATRALERIQAHLHDLQQGVTSQEEALRRANARQQERQEISQNQLHKIKHELHKRNEELTQRSLDWLHEFFIRIEKELLPQILRYDYQKLQHHLPFFLSQSLQEAWDACLFEHQQDLYQELVQFTPQTARLHSLFDDPSHDQLTLRTFVHPPEVVGTELISFAGFLAGFAGMLILPGLLLQMVAGIVDKEWGDERRAEKYRSKLKESLTAMEAQVQKAMRDTGGSINKAAAEHLEQRWGHDQQQLQDTLQQVLELRQQDKEQLQKTLHELEIFQSLMQRHQERLSQHIHKLQEMFS